MTATKENHMDVNRRGFMQCMAWAGTGVLWTMAGGVLSSCSLAGQGSGGGGTWSFAQISDTHVGFNGPANKDSIGTLPNEFVARRVPNQSAAGMRTRPSPCSIADCIPSMRRHLRFSQTSRLKSTPNVPRKT